MAEVFDFGLQQHKIKMDGKFFENNLFAVAGDTGRRLEVQLLDSNNMVQNTAGISLRLNADVAGQATYAEATLVDAAKGLYELDLPNGMLIAPGNWQFQWQIIGTSGEKLHSFAFTGSVGSNLSEGGTEATNFYLNAEELKQMQDDLINGTFDSEVLETNIAEKLNNLEEQYAPKLTEVTAQLAEKASISYVDAILMDVAKGGPNSGPQGPFMSLATLYSHDFPDGKKGTWLVFDTSFGDGAHSFMWDSTNSIWKDLGVYQATGLADRSLKNESLTDEVITSRTLHNSLTKELNGYTSKITSSNQHWLLFTGFLPVNLSSGDIVELSFEIETDALVDNLSGFIGVPNYGALYSSNLSITPVHKDACNYLYEKEYVIPTNGGGLAGQSINVLAGVDTVVDFSEIYVYNVRLKLPDDSVMLFNVKPTTTYQKTTDISFSKYPPKSLVVRGTEEIKEGSVNLSSLNESIYEKTTALNLIAKYSLGRTDKELIPVFSVDLSYNPVAIGDTISVSYSVLDVNPNIIGRIIYFGNTYNQTASIQKNSKETTITFTADRVYTGLQKVILGFLLEDKTITSNLVIYNAYLTLNGTRVPIPINTYSGLYGSQTASGIEKENVLENINLFGYSVGLSSSEKKGYVFGDSTTYGDLGTINGVQQGRAKKPWAKLVSEITGYNVVNKGKNGADTGMLVGIMTHIKDRSTYSPTETPDYSDIDFVTIMIGANDGVSGLATSIPYDFGKSVDTLPFDFNEYSITTENEYWNLFPNNYFGNVSLCIEYVKFKNPKTKIYLITPPHSSRENWEQTTKIRTAMLEIGNMYSVTIVDAQVNTGIDKKHLHKYSNDLTHLTELGNELFGRYVAKRISTT